MSIDFVRASIRQNAMDSEIERLNRIVRAWNYYNGAAPMSIAKSHDGSDDNVRFNLARTLVAKGVSWLIGASRPLTFSIEGNPTKTDTLENDVWPLRVRAKVISHLAVNGAVCGHTFCRLLPDGRVVVWDPTNTTAIWDDEDIDHVIEFRREWIVGVDDDNTRVRRQRVVETTDRQRWIIIDEESSASGDSFTELRREMWERPWSPVFHAQYFPTPNEFWGQAELEKDVLDLIDNIERVGGYANKVVRHKGHPLPYATGESAKNIAQIDVSVGQFLALPNPEAKVGQLEATSLEGVLELYGKLWEAFHFVTRTPPIGFGVTNLVNVAEETVELAYSPAVERTWDTRLCFGPMLTELTGRMMELAGEGEGFTPSPNWPQIIPRSETKQAAAYETDLRMGIVSKETIADLRGYKWDVEHERRQEESQEAAEEMERNFNAGNMGGPFGNGAGAPVPQGE